MGIDIIIFNGKWDGETAKSDLFKWGRCPKDDSILSKKMLSKYFMKVSGDGKNESDYSYPVARVINGKPQYDRDGLMAAFSAARGAHTGIVDTEIANKIVSIFKREFGTDEMSEGMKEVQKQNEVDMTRELFRNEESTEIGEIGSSEVSWDDSRAKKSLIDWGTDDYGKIQKKLLMRWFLDIDGGSGQNPLDYRYPVGNVFNGNPSYDALGIDHSWDLASGKKTGIANRMIQRKIIFLKQREKIPLTDEQLEFVSRHMTSRDFTKQNEKNIKIYKNELRTAVISRCSDDFYVDVKGGNIDLRLNANNEEDALEVGYNFAKSGNVSFNHIKLNDAYIYDDSTPGCINENSSYYHSGTVKYNSVAHYGKVLVETDDYIDIPVIPMREGVFTGIDGIPTLKKFDVFAKDAHWLEGQPILRGHTRPNEIVTYRHDRIGKLKDVQVRPRTKDVYAIARYWKDKISPDELNKIRSGNPYDGSIAYTCETIPESGEYDGEKYNAIEETGYHFYHFAEVGEGACSVDKGCGFNLNSSNNYVVNNNEDNTMIGKVKENGCSEKKGKKKEEMSEDMEEEVLVVDEDGNECMESELVDGMCRSSEETEETGEVKENSADRFVRVEVKIPEEFEIKMNSMISENESILDSIQKINDRLDKIDEIEMSEKVEDVINLNESALMEDKDFKEFELSLNMAAKPDAIKHYNEFKSKGWSYVRSSGIMKMNESGEQKQMGVGYRVGNVSSDLAEEKAKLRRTLGRKN